MSRNNRSFIGWNIWQKKVYLFWWCFGIIALVVLVMAFYPPFRDQAQQFDQQFSSQIPESAKAFISDTQDFLSPIGYLSSQIYYLMLPIILSIMAIGLGSSLIGREEKDGTIELLLSRPVSRNRLLVIKSLTGIILLFIVVALSFLTTLISAYLVKLPIGTINLAVTSLACFLLALSFGSVSFLITMFGKARIASLGVATIFALGGYIISSLSEVATWLEWPSKFFPFHYYMPAEMLSGNPHWSNMLFSISVIFICAIGSWFSFRKRDIVN